MVGLSAIFWLPCCDRRNDQYQCGMSTPRTLRGLFLRRSVKTGLYGLVIAGVIGGSAAWAHSPAQKTIALRIDGHNQQVHTTASKVSGALSAAGIAVGAHDIVAPDL